MLRRQRRNRNRTFNGVCVLLILSSFLAATVLPTHAATYNMKYDMTYTGVPFAGGAIVLASNFTNIGQLTIRVTSISFASDFWNNGTRIVTSGLMFNLTAGASMEIQTPVFIPSDSSIGNHVVTATASWQYSNSTGWHDASPIPTSATIVVSQTIGSLFAGFATVLVIGLIVAAVAVAIIVIIVVLQRRRSKPAPSPPAPSDQSPQSGTN